MCARVLIYDIPYETNAAYHCARARDVDAALDEGPDILEWFAVSSADQRLRTTLDRLEPYWSSTFILIANCSPVSSGPLYYWALALYTSLTFVNTARGMYIEAHSSQRRSELDVALV